MSIIPNTLGSSDKSLQQEEVSDVRRYLHVLLAHRWLILGTMAVVLGAVAIWTYSRQRIYRSTASMIVSPKPPSVMGSKVRNVVELRQDSNKYMDTQVAIACSKTTAQRVVEKMGLHRIERFWPPVKKKGALISKTADQAANRLRGLSSCSTRISANIIDVSVEHWDPRMAATLANEMADAYMNGNLGFYRSSTSGSVEWLSTQLDELKNKLVNAEMALYDFKKENDLIAVSLSDRQNLLGGQISKINNARVEAKLKRMKYAAGLPELDLARKDPTAVAGKLPSFRSEIISKLRSKLVDANEKYLALRSRYLEKHPKVLEQYARLKSARQELKKEVLNVVKVHELRYQQAKRHERSLINDLKKVKEEAHEVNKGELAYLQLERRSENAAKIYGLVLSRLKENNLTSNLQVNNIRRLDKAVPSWAAVRPRVRVSLMIGGFMGLLLGIGLAFAVSALDNTIKSLEDVEDQANIACLGFIPSIPNQQDLKRKGPRELCIHYSPTSVTAESCRAIRTNILFSSPDSSVKKFVITSPGPEEGKTTTAVSIAVTMAQAGNKVLIIDADMRRPQLHRVFGVPRYEGLSTALVGDASFENVDTLIKATEVPNLFILPCGPTPPNPAELCQSERLYNLLNHLGDGFDWVILDSPPLLTVTDPVLLGKQCDGTLLVARTGRTPKASLQAANRTLHDVGINILGCVLNDLDLTHHSYYRYLRYRYYAYGYYRSNQSEQAAG